MKNHWTFFTFVLCFIQAVYASTGIFVGGSGSKKTMYVSCDTTLWHCVGTYDKDQATKFEQVGDSDSPYYPYNQYRVVGTSPALCENVLDYNVELSLTTCTPGTSPPDNELFRVEVHADSDGNSVWRVVNKYRGDRKLWWQGDQTDIVVAESCTDSAWQCFWKWVPENNVS